MITFFIGLLFLALTPGTDVLESIPGKGGDPVTQETFEKKLEVAIEHFYQTRWEEAKDSFRELKEHSPGDPRPHFFESMMPFWEYFFIHQQSELADLFLDRSENAVKLSTQRLKNQPGDTTMVLLLSGLHGYRSLVAAGEKNYRIAIQSGITGFNYTRQLLSIDSDRPDAQIGRGMFYYMAGSVPKEVRWLTNVAGMRGNVEMGFKELEKAATSDNAIKYDAQMMLMYLHEKEENYSEALEYAQMLSERFSENVIFHFKCGELYALNGINDMAIKSYQKVISWDNSYLKQVRDISKARIDELYAIGSKDF